ncbi:hypothetical protein D7S81_22265 [Ralstonia insidiosa]|nr:hypothetical protein [Ralstonia insidiosa]MBA9939326.1 hypothetical protein [Ralstonia insidiosa]
MHQLAEWEFVMKDSDTSIQNLGYSAEQVQAIKHLADLHRQPVGFAMGVVTTLPISKGDPSDKES